jgi:thioredoxin 2
MAVNRVSTSAHPDSAHCGKCHQPLLTGEPIDMRDDTLPTLIARSEVPVVVDFWATWCAPCRMMAPQFAQAAGQLKGQAVLVKVDTDANPELSRAHQIRSIPTLAIFKGGREVARQSGAMPVSALVQWVRQHL